MRYSPVSPLPFEARTAFFTSVGMSAKSRGASVGSTFRAILNNPLLNPDDRPCVNAAWAIVVRGGGKWVDEFVNGCRDDYYCPPRP